MTYLILFLTVLLLQNSQGEYSCTDGRKLFGDICIEVFDGPDNQTTWHVARDKCHKLNATLVTIRSAEKQAFLAARIGGDVWIDLTRDSSSDTFQWANGPPELNYTDWKTGEPNNGGENCAVLLSDYLKGLWNDKTCFSHYYYICQAAAGTHGCEPDWIPLAGKCFNFSQNMTDWFKAREICQKSGGDLAIIPDAHWNKLITDKQHEAYHRRKRTHWIGASDVKSEGVWKWLDQPQEMEYENWADHAPDNGYSMGFHACIHVASGHSLKMDGAWETKQCRVFYRAVCERTPLYYNGTTTCTNDWKLYRNQSCIGMTQERSSWDGSRAKCKQLGGDLVVVKDRQKGIFVRYIVKAKNAWIGLHDRDLDAGWTWLDSNKEATYFEWAVHYPMESLLRNWNCTFIRSTSTSLGRWANHYCSAEYGYICKAKGYCDSGWLSFSGYCYKLNYDLCGWHEARDRCRLQNANADLVVIENQVEQLWLQGKIDRSADVGGFWIGLNSLKQKKKFAWLDSTNLAKYTNWDARMPSYIQQEACAVSNGPYSNGAWKDEDCSFKNNYICERPADGGASYYDFRYKSSVYKIIMSKFTKDHGDEYCQKSLGMNSMLITVDDDEELNHIMRELDARGLITPQIRSFWTSQTETATEANSPTASSSIPEYSSKKCLEFTYTVQGPWTSRSYTPKLQPSVCCEEKYIVCEKHIDVKHPDVYKYDFALNTSIYRLVDEEVLEHDAANKRCAQLLDNSGSLAEFETTDEWRAVSREVLARHLGEHFVYWVGGDPLDQNSTNVMPKSQFTMTDAHCLVLEYNPVESKNKLDATMTLESAPCSEKKKFLCEENIHMHLASFANLFHSHWQKYKEESSHKENSYANRPGCTGTCLGLAVAFPFVVMATVLLTVGYFWFIKRELPIPVRFRKLSGNEEVNLTI